MQTILGRLDGFLYPFYCQFATPNPVQPLPPPRDPLCGLPLELWLEIFQLATYSSRSTSIKPTDPFATHRALTRNIINTMNTPALALQTKLALVAVCKAWRSLGTPILYCHIVVRSPMRAALILRTLEDTKRDPLSGPNPASNPSLGHGRWTRHIEIFTHSRGCTSAKYLQTVFSILQHCPYLRILSGTWNHTLPPTFLDAVSTLYGPSLEGLYWNETTDKLGRQQYRFTASATLEFLASFKSLLVLDLRHFKLKNEPDINEASMRPILPSVQHLIISTNPWSVATAACLILPGLRALTVITGSRLPELTREDRLHRLVKLHGSSLSTVDILSPTPDESARMAKRLQPSLFLQPSACPNLTAISFPACSIPFSEGGHPSLRRIGLHGAKSESLYPDRAGDAKDHLKAILSSGCYPSLELVQTVGFYVETESDVLIKDIFIWWTEQFAKEGVDLLDGEGVLWEYEELDPSAADVGKLEEDSKERECTSLNSLQNNGAPAFLIEGNRREVVKKQKIEDVSS
ncbi:hypothetical protein FA13DRAFT_1681967 [Coprinellus micaceus]|uniref:F-box domain-containing protein n=1 Tax=Coprinellus micaceus TaxID=71717 RepID=A0A4Y7TWG5_COPMI|nr:hypothetical protein FA13DRAFT_1681967 [Coprinellus micaceus]